VRRALKISGSVPEHDAKAPARCGSAGALWGGRSYFWAELLRGERKFQERAAVLMGSGVACSVELAGGE
jgi:hypothetical protein